MKTTEYTLEQKIKYYQSMILRLKHEMDYATRRVENLVAQRDKQDAKHHAHGVRVEDLLAEITKLREENNKLEKQKPASAG